MVETKEEPEDEGPQDGGLSCGGGPDEPCRRRAWAGILPHQRALLCPLHAPAPPLEQIPEEALEILKDGIETDMPLRCAQALQFHLKDITACPYAICDIRRYGDKGEVIGTSGERTRPLQVVRRRGVLSYAFIGGDALHSCGSEAPRGVPHERENVIDSLSEPTVHARDA